MRQKQNDKSNEIDQEKDRNEAFQALMDLLEDPRVGSKSWEKSEKRKQKRNEIKRVERERKLEEKRLKEIEEAKAPPTLKRQVKVLLRDPRADVNTWEIKEEYSKSGGKIKRRKTPVYYKVIAIVFLGIVCFGGFFVVRNFNTAKRADTEGMQAFTEGNYSNAVTLFKQAVNVKSKNVTYKMHLGMAQIEAAMFDDALTTFQSIVDEHKGEDRRLAYRSMGITYLYKSQYKEAVEAFKNVLEDKKGSYSEMELDVAFYLAEAQSKSGDPVEAVLTYTKILEQKKDANVYLLRGLAYQQVGDNTNAEKDLQQAIGMDSKNFKLYISLAEIYDEQGKSLDAKKALLQAVELPVKTAQDYANRGFALLDLKKYENVPSEYDPLADFEYAIKAGYTPAWFGKANLLMKQGDYTGAVESFDTFFETTKDNALAYNQYGVCMMNLGNYERAIEAFKSAVALNDRLVNQEALFNEIVVYERTSDWKTAYEVAKEYAEKYPTDEKGMKEFTFLESRQY